jgi:geranylgeranyl pyrophosphate synthase
MVDVAIAAELIHVGSLLQDDVIDAATHRRGEATISAHYGERSAVLVGDLLMTVALQRLQPYVPELIHDALDAIARMSKAALTEISCRGQLELGQATWRDIVEGKTGALFAFCARGAARIGDRPDDYDRFFRAGMHLGVAFQLGDDLLDLWPSNTGKEPFADLRNQECTFPVVFATEIDSDLAKAVRHLWAKNEAASSDEIERLGARVRGASAREILRRMRSEIAMAMEILSPYGTTAGARGLADWAEQLLHRAQELAQPPTNMRQVVAHVP